MADTTDRTSLYETLGRAGTIGLVWHCTPLPLRWLALPYGVYVYTHLLRQCTDLGQLKWMHRDLYRRSMLFRWFRPRYRLVEAYLEQRQPQDADPPAQTQSTLPHHGLHLGPA
jgi:hypothetical protein